MRSWKSTGAGRLKVNFWCSFQVEMTVVSTDEEEFVAGVTTKKVEGNFAVPAKLIAIGVGLKVR